LHNTLTLINTSLLGKKLSHIELLIIRSVHLPNEVLDHKITKYVMKHILFWPTSFIQHTILKIKWHI